jgi:hypothetical protein
LAPLECAKTWGARVAPPVRRASISASVNRGRPYMGCMMVLSKIVCTACGDACLVGLLLLAVTGDAGVVGLPWLFRKASQPSFPKNLIKGERCADSTGASLSALIASVFTATCAGGAGVLPFVESDADDASTVAAASVSSSYSFAPTSTVSSLHNTKE